MDAWMLVNTVGGYVGGVRCSTVSSADFGYFDHIGSIHQRWRLGFRARPASSAVAKFIAMMIVKTGIHDLKASCMSAATGPPSTEPTPCAMYRKPCWS